MAITDALELERDRLLARLAILRRQHEALHSRPDDRDGHEKHRADLRADGMEVQAYRRSSRRIGGNVDCRTLTRLARWMAWVHPLRSHAELRPSRGVHIDQHQGHGDLTLLSRDLDDPEALPSGHRRGYWGCTSDG